MTRYLKALPGRAELSGTSCLEQDDNTASKGSKGGCGQSSLYLRRERNVRRPESMDSPAEPALFLSCCSSGPSLR